MVIDVGKAVRGARCLAIVMVCACCASCTITQAPGGYHIKEYSEKAHGVKAGLRAPHSKHIRKSGGRYIIGKPYRMKGTRYFPKEDPTYDKNGFASWYGSAFRGRLTANGEVYNPRQLSAAHPTLPLPSYVRVTNLDNVGPPRFGCSIWAAPAWTDMMRATSWPPTSGNTITSPTFIATSRTQPA